MDEALVKEVFADEDFIKKLLCLETPQEVQTAMSGKGIDLTVDQIVKIKDLVVKRLETGEELSDADLQDVTGGSMCILGLSLVATSLVLVLLTGGLAVGSCAAGVTVSGAWITDTLTNHKW